ncbi:hypothetical protein MYCTH_2299137 [Thermothelomyces thermophilus ATCC 42464]|uniref:Pre-mRNA-splicing factor CWC26 n=1 Tax=Thermothelomyces thermophilus (strain ATCC 42464 / BCRC 31852 / DSM 1799) TaxID=573729 RepID=G2Q4T8_THET4|nr:uncharacterized protein MYCTH_2299137 [Thermothelomyces thermophilus ATCC 42464]AEO55377.1 hypothetical protein MYCTH_2299137 [Thermothelomyces thermophilus ATCC 42464]
MPSDKAAYLAAHYLTVESKSSSSSTKKRKRKQPAASGLLITDDDETGWDASTHKKDDAEEDDTPITIAGTMAEFRRAKKSGWKTVGDAPALSSSKNGTTTSSSSSSTAAAAKPTDAADAAAEADAIIASAAAEKAAAAAAEEAEDLQVPVMSNGTLAGLQSASALTAQLRKRQELEAAELAELRAAAESQKKNNNNKNKDDAEPEVILRDATGRRVDASLRRAEARRQAAEAERAAKAKQDLLRGEVQAAEARARRERLEDAALLPLARGRDDAELNEELKRAERWNDPMAEFMASSAAGGGGGESGGARTGGTKRGRPVYKGPAPPNRYGIRPGYRWDGVDRSNGFEAERFKALNRREMQKGLEYTWQMDE